MTPEEGNPLEVEGVLNPASGGGRMASSTCCPRLVAAGNVSRIGLARVVVEDGVPVGVERQGVVLEPDRSWERGVGNAGVEDPRITWMADLGLHVMTYVAYGPLGPRTALAVSTDLREWRRLGPVLFTYDDALDIDLNLFHNKDAVFFPEPVIAPDGVRSFAVLHRPMWDLSETKADQGVVLPAGIDDPRQSIWISYVPVDAVAEDLSALTLWSQHRFLAGPEYPFEVTKIGGGPAPLRVPEGWLLLHHGVTGPSSARSTTSRTSTTPRERCCSTATIPRSSSPARRSRCCRPRPRTSAAASCRTSSSPPRSRRSTACGTCSTAWRTRRSAWRGSTTCSRHAPRGTRPSRVRNPIEQHRAKATGERLT